MSLPPSIQLRSAILVGGGVPACAAIVVSFGWIGVASVMAGPRLPTRDWVAGAVFVSLALVALGVSGRASWRVLFGGATAVLPTLAKVLPVLALVGACGGAWFGQRISEDRRAHGEERLAEFCAAAALFNVVPAECAEKARHCEAHAVFDDAKTAKLDKVVVARIVTLDGDALQATRANDFSREGELREQRRVYERLHDALNVRRPDDARVLTCLFVPE